MKFSQAIISLLTEAPEDRLAFVAKRFQKLTKTQLAAIGKADPSPTGEYIPWIARLTATGGVRMPEDVEKIHATLKQFHWLKTEKRSIRGSEADIIRYKTYGDLARKVDDLTGAHGTGDKPMLTDVPGASTIYFKHPWQVIEVTDAAQARRLASGTHWCVTQPYYAKQYLRQGPLYFIMRSGKPHVLYHKQTEQLMDVHDTPLDDDAIKHVITPMFHAGLASTDSKLPKRTALRSAIIYVTPPPMDVITSDPYVAISYAIKVIGGAFKEGEKAIASNYYTAREYAHHVIKKPFPDGEPVLFKKWLRYRPYWDRAETDVVFGDYAKLVWEHEGRPGLMRLMDIVAKVKPTSRSRKPIEPKRSWTPLQVALFNILKNMLDAEGPVSIVPADTPISDYSQRQENRLVESGPYLLVRPWIGQCPGKEARLLAFQKNQWKQHPMLDLVEKYSNFQGNAVFAEGFYVFKNHEPFAQILRTGRSPVVFDADMAPATADMMTELTVPIGALSAGEVFFTSKLYDPEQNGGHNYLARVDAIQALHFNPWMADLWIEYGQDVIPKKMLDDYLLILARGTMAHRRRRTVREVVDDLNKWVAASRIESQIPAWALDKVIPDGFHLKAYIELVGRHKRMPAVERAIKRLAWSDAAKGNLIDTYIAQLKNPTDRQAVRQLFNPDKVTAGGVVSETSSVADKLYHGSHGKKAASIIRDKEIKASGTSIYKGSLAPRQGRISLTRSLEVARFMATNAMFSSNDHSGGVRVFEVDPSTVKDVQADEDDLAMVLLDRANGIQKPGYDKAFAVIDKYLDSDALRKIARMSARARVKAAKELLDRVNSAPDHAILADRCVSVSVASPVRFTKVRK